MSDEKTVYLPIVGMHCASCVGRVQNALDRVPGARAEVNFGTESARVSYDPDRISPRELVGAVDGVGYRVGTARIEMPIEGMHCASCVTRVEKALKTAPGVLDASVNLALERAIVDGIAGAFSWDDLKARVESAGSYRVADAAASGDAADPAHARRAETRSLVRRLVVGIALGAPVVADMIAHMAGVHPFGGAARPWILLALTAPVFAYSGWPFHRGLIASLRHRTADMNTLISLGTSVAFFESFLNTAWPSLMRHPGAGGHFNYDSAIMIIVLILVGRITESRSKAEASGAIRALLELAPRKALARRDADWREVDAASLRPGDIVRLRPGEAVAADGVVTEGRTWVDESMLTGESRPVAKQIGDAIIGGTVNQSGAVVYEVRRTGDATVLAKIIRAVRDAQAHKPRVQRLADKIASVFVPAVITIAALAFTAWLVFGPEPALPLALLSATAVLIIACPCALGLATPTAIMVGTGVAARLGILIRGGESLELARRLDTIVFDKTGTLTRGEMSVTRVTPAEGFDAADVLAAAAAIERASEHPIARAIVAAATPGDAAIVEAADVEISPGLGLRGRVAGARVAVGSPAYAREIGIGAEALRASIDEAARDGESAVVVAIDGVAAGTIAVSDPPKDDAAQTVARLREMGFSVAMLTGDARPTAAAVAARLGIEDVIAEVLPDKKAERIAQLQDEGRVVAMVGDGINDAPALARADLGIALSSGTDVAIESADLAIVGPRLMTVVTSIEISRRTLSAIRQNLFFAFIYNVVGIPLAAGGFYLLTGGPLPPTFAAAAMAASSISVISNSLRLRRAFTRAPEDTGTRTAAVAGAEA